MAIGRGFTDYKNRQSVVHDNDWYTTFTPTGDRDNGKQIVLVGGNPNGGAHYRKRTACGNGHEYVEGSWRFRAYDGTRECLICRRVSELKRQAKRGTPAGARMRELEAQGARVKRAAKRLGMAVADYRQLIGDAELKKNPLDYLRLDTVASKAQDDFGYAVDMDKLNRRPKCESDPDAWTFDPDEEPPSQKAAELACEGCPFFVECDRLGRALIPTKVSGIWAGKRFTYGQVLEEELV